MKPSLLLLGGRKFFVPREHATAVMNVLLEKGYSYEQVCFTREGDVTLVCALASAKAFAADCAERGLSVTVVGDSGLPPLLLRYRKRFGLLLGGMLAVLLVFLSEQFVWDVRISGNVNLSEEEVLEELEACGLSVGSYIPRLHTVSLENRVLMHSERISWLSVCLDGTVAQVQVIEHVPPTVGEESHASPANVVASCDGQIEWVELYRGNCAVKIGQAVRKGDLLISGVYDSATQGSRYTRAAGRVLARTERVFHIEIPLSCETKCYGKTQLSSLSMNFFDFFFNFYKKGGNGDEMYDIITEEICFSWFGSHALPFSLTAERAVLYEMQPYRRTAQEASDLAYAALEYALSALSDDAQLLRKSIVPTLTEDAFVLECTVVCIEDIACQLDFEMIQQP